ncbi:PepSY domain-containing protein [Virgibacillus sp. W0181]|uniref:PepSY domain-containing protein n=1 Tax=Virgibacillus sp. W0181 TaxID=3391581 RepID=UPI003F471FBB
MTESKFYKRPGMKKKIIIAASGVVAAAVFGLGIYQSDAAQADPELSFEEIEQLVADQYPGTITELELEKDLNKAVYEVEVESEGKEYDLKLDGNSGEVLQLKEKELAITEKETEDNTAKPGATKDDDSDDQNSTGTDKKSADKSKGDTKTVIDTKEAIEIAVNEFSGTVTSVELDEDDDRLIYEVEIESDQEEAEIEIDAYTGEVLVMEIDD